MVLGRNFHIREINTLIVPFERSLSSFQKIRKLLIQGIQVMAAERVPEPLIKRGGGGIALELEH